MIQQAKRSFIKQVMAAAVLGVTGAGAMAQDKPLTLMVPFPPGGVSDGVARAMGPSLAKRLGRVVIVENLGGVGGGLAAQKVLDARADGSMVFVGSPTEMVLTPLANSAVKYKSENFKALSIMADQQFAIAGSGKLPPRNLHELLEYAAQAAKKGTPLTYGSVGYGSIFHLMGEQFSVLTGIPMTHVPYKGGGPMLQDLLGGQIDLFFGGYTATSLEMTKQGRLKFFASMTDKPAVMIPQVPTVQETPSLKGFTYSLWLGFFVKQETPDAVANTLHRAIEEVLMEPAVMEAIKVQTVIQRPPQSMQEASAAYAAETAKFRAIAKAINLQPQ